MITELKENIKLFLGQHEKDILLGILIFLACLLCLALGYLAASYQQKKPIEFRESFYSLSG
jgi:hypothetical protein